jgi:hypothetical protein
MGRTREAESSGLGARIRTSNAGWLRVLRRSVIRGAGGSFSHRPSHRFIIRRISSRSSP